MARKENKKQLISEAIENIKSDRNVAGLLLTKLLQYILENQERHKEVGTVAAKYLETLQRSNEQMVKLISIMKTNSNELSEEDKEKLFDEINEISDEE